MSKLYDTHFINKLRLSVARSLTLWGFSKDAFVSLLTVSENATFQVIDDDSRYVVRVYRPLYHSVDEIESELLWIAALRANKIVRTPRPVPLIAGGMIATFGQAEAVRYMVAFEFMPGEEPSTGRNLVSRFTELGALTAKLHGHTRVWIPPKGFARKTWDFDTTIGSAPHWGQWENCLELTLTDKMLLNSTVAIIHKALDNYGTSSDRFGLVHADLRLANLLADEDTLAVLDFDDCGFSWYVYDFAAAISFIEEDRQVPELLQAWLSGYRGVAPLTQADEQMIPAFIMMRRIMLTAWLNTHSETPTMQELGAKFVEGTLRMARKMLQTGTPLDTEPVSNSPTLP